MSLSSTILSLLQYSNNENLKIRKTTSAQRRTNYTEKIFDTNRIVEESTESSNNYDSHNATKKIKRKTGGRMKTKIERKKTSKKKTKK